MFTGCRAVDFYAPSLEATTAFDAEIPRELSMVSLPAYRIEPPDAVRIDVLKLVPRFPYRIGMHDVLEIRALWTLVDQPIDDYYYVDGEGNLNLGPAYGSVRIVGMNIEEATEEILQRLRVILMRPIVDVQLIRSADAEQLSAMHRISSDGTINLGRYGNVHVAGKTVTEASVAIEQHLKQYFDESQVSVDVVDYRSKGYYVITAGAEGSENIQKFAISGNETVLDAIARMQGLSHISSKTMWVARPVPASLGAEEILPVDWVAITRGGVTDTNYQILPRDRIYIVDDKLVATNNFLAGFTEPINSMLRLSQLGTTTTRTAQTLGRTFNFSRLSR
jgi:polysaccharide biosynthesis/export protein